MGTRTVVECDRCKREVKDGLTKKVEHKSFTVNGDLCPGCATKLKRFLDGEELEVPP